MAVVSVPPPVNNKTFFRENVWNKGWGKCLADNSFSGKKVKAAFFSHLKVEQKKFLATKNERLSEAGFYQRGPSFKRYFWSTRPVVMITIFARICLSVFLSLFKISQNKTNIKWKQCSLLAGLLVRLSGSLMTQVLFYFVLFSVFFFFFSITLITKGLLWFIKELK